MNLITLAQYASRNNDSGLGSSVLTLVAIIAAIAIVFATFIFIVKRYRRCPSNRILVIYGKVSGSRAARAMHGGGTFVWPVIQDFAYLSLEPLTIDIELTSALSKKNIRVGVPSTFTVGISTDPDIMNNAAERLLGLTEGAIQDQARDIILGQMRLVIATLTIEEINQDREKFLDLVNKNVNAELNKVGLYMINVNIRDITDESGYIQALGKKAAAEAINQAKVDTAIADREGSIGTATADREREVKVSEQVAQSQIGQKSAERDQRISVSKLEAEGVTGEAQAAREQEIAVAEQGALAVQGKKSAEATQRIEVASLEANAVEGENQSKAKIANYQATLTEAEADAKRRGEVAWAKAAEDVLIAEKAQELARLEKEVIAKQMIERKQVEIDAEAEAERIRRVAQGEADAILAKYKAEAEGIQKVLTAKATGYENLIKMTGNNPQLAPSLLIIEKLPELVKEQVKAVQNLKIDKITVWDSENGGTGERSTAGFLSSLINSLPPMHELASQAGIDLPQVLGQVKELKPDPKPDPKPEPQSEAEPNPKAKKQGDTPTDEDLA